MKGRRTKALELLREAVQISQEIGHGYAGPRVFGALAATTDDPIERQRALEEGERLLRSGAVGHNHFDFYRDGMEAGLAIGDFDRVEHYAVALEEYTRPEPLPWADFFISRGRALAAFNRGKRDDTTIRELQRLRDEAEHLGLKLALSGIEEALAAA